MTLTPEAATINILIVDDHKLSNECLKLGLEKESDLHILGQAFDGISAVEMTKSLKPNMILMDVCMPNQNGIQATAAIKKLFPDVKVVMTTSMMDKKVVQAAFAANADGYCTKETQLSQLVQMIRTVMNGAVCIDPKVALYAIREIAGVQDIDSINTTAMKPVSPLLPEQPLVKQPEQKLEKALSKPVFSESPFINAPIKENVSAEKPKPLAVSAPPVEKQQEWNNRIAQDNTVPPIHGKIEDHLTQRELEILKLIADNNNNQQISDKTGLSMAWLASHIKNILMKLSVSNEIQAIQRALHEGLIEDAPLLYQAD